MCLLPNLVLHAGQVDPVPSALDLCKRFRVHGASHKQDCRVELWRLHYVVAVSFQRSSCRGAKGLEEIVNAVRDSRPIFSNCHFSFHLTCYMLLCWIIFEPSCAGTCFTVVRLLLVAGVRRHTGYMEQMTIESLFRTCLSCSFDFSRRWGTGITTTD